MNAVDSSVVVAAFASWHESHEVARRAVDRRPRLVAHVLVVTFLDGRFPEEPLTLAPRSLQHLVKDLEHLGIAGGAVYDGLVAMSAAAHEATLLTLDHRAEATYRRCGVRARFLDGDAS